ncbi:M28 family metallopeptidase [Acididesulfobacillus acetoxydans]|uniref:M28 family metallopeptidase n=1 Tax=Acididesulfobacillus acetoxydans TaxID=1561005 RepID=UPI0030B806BE
MKFLAGLSAGFLPWYGWPETLKKVDALAVKASVENFPSAVNTGSAAIPAGKAFGAFGRVNPSYLKRTASDDIAVLAQPALAGRRAGSAGEGKAAAYLQDQMRGLGLQPLGDRGADGQRLYTQAFTIYPVVEEFANFYYGRHLTFSLGDPKDLRTPSANILAGLMGTRAAESVILSAHYDHMGIFEGNLYPGANDNASGVGSILDVMRRLIKEGVRPKSNVLLAFWSAEEMGFVGSSAFIKNPGVPLGGIRAVFNADTVGNGSLHEFALWADGENTAVRTLQAVARECNSSAPVVPNHGYDSDQYYFNLNHVPATTLMARTWLEKNHTPQDVPDFVNPQKVALASDILYKAVHRLAF